MSGSTTPGTSNGAAVSSKEGSASWRAFSTVLDRLEQALDDETAALKTRTAADFVAFSHRKRQGLLELSRSLPHLAGGEYGAAASARLAGLNDKLEQNRSALDVQLRAVREVSAIIERSMRDAESDGTYSNQSVWQ